MARDQLTPEAVESRMQNQLGEEEKMQRCNFIITNDETVLVVPQVLDLHNKLLQLSSV